MERIRNLQIHVCPECAAHLVYPTAWREADNDCWEIALRCPNCEWAERGIYLHEDVELFDAVLNRGTDVVVGDLERLSRANMEADVQRFLTALEHDHILPEDF